MQNPPPGASPGSYPPPGKASSGSGLDPKIAAARKLNFTAHGKGEVRGGKVGAIDSFWDFCAAIKALGIPTNPLARRCDSIDDGQMDWPRGNQVCNHSWNAIATFARRAWIIFRKSAFRWLSLPIMEQASAAARHR